jgi:ferredoxin
MSTLHVDWTRCRGRGLCVELLPELVARDEWGYPLTRTDVEVPPDLEEHAARAVRDCPRMALGLRPAP